MIIQFMEPDPGVITTEMTRDILALAGARIAVETIQLWTGTERVVAFDWAAREHLSASDNAIDRRDKPWFVTVAAAGHVLTAAAFQAACEKRLRQYESEYSATHLTWQDFAGEMHELFAAAGIEAEGSDGR